MLTHSPHTWHFCSSMVIMYIILGSQYNSLSKQIHHSTNLGRDAVMLEGHGQLRLADGARRREVIGPAGLERLHSRPGTLHAHVHELVGQQAATSTAAERVLTDRVGGHLAEVTDHRTENLAGLLGQAARPREVTGVVVGNALAVIGSFVDRKSTRLNSSHLGISYAVF